MGARKEIRFGGNWGRMAYAKENFFFCESNLVALRDRG